MTVIQRIKEVESYIEVLQIQAYKHFESGNTKSHNAVSDMISEQKKELEKLTREFHCGQRTLRIRNVIYN